MFANCLLNLNFIIFKIYVTSQFFSLIIRLKQEKEEKKKPMENFHL